METFGKSCQGPSRRSATVTRMLADGRGRFALRLGVVCGLLAAGAVSSLLAAGSGAVRATTATTATSALVTSPAPSVLVLRGHGWGHGLGLSQWGAYGYAKRGWTYDRILAHYYSGTTLGPAKIATVRVLLAEGKKATLDSVVAWSVTDATNQKVALAPGTLVLKPKLVVPGKQLTPPLTFTSKQPLVVAGKPYRGKIRVLSDGKTVQVIDVLGLEAYLKGVVPAEMPSAWSPEALKAQAVAARSYALAGLAKGKDYDLYSDTRSQVYGGLDAEVPATNDAVDVTKGEIVLYNGKVANTLFFSTSGGRTASAAETTGTAVPYLVSVTDPYDTASPYHDWGPVLFDAAKVAKQLKLPAPLADLRLTTGPSGRAKTVVALTADDRQVTLSGSQLRAQLELRSTWFTPALLSLAPAAKTIAYGGAVSLTGFARGADSVSLESKTAAQDWTPVGELLLDGDGAFATILKPLVATQYRLVSGTVRAGLTKIAVAARVDAQMTAAGARGTMRPALAGAAVQLQQQSGAAWTTLATGVTDTAGGWSFAQALTTGTYRVRCAPGHGLAPGLSAPIAVP
jgi:SpoIID/LytB domain protein